MKLSRIQKDKKGVLKLLRKTNLKPNLRLELYAFVQRFFWRIKYSKEEYRKLVEYQSLSPSNLYYGHEYWLKKYSGYNDRIYALIEHGVYFGDNRSKVGDEEEWSLGSIITFGDSRVELLNELYPDYNIVPIGPKIHYAETSKEYYNELYNQIDHTGKVLTLFPAHSEATEKSIYDSELFMKQANELAEKIGAKTIMVSLHPSDYLHKLDSYFMNKNVVYVGGGTDSLLFLPRQRAIFELSDLTFSNAIGTHVGYSIYMKTPHIMNLESNNIEITNDVYNKEQETFASVFNGEDPLTITEEQFKLCDYYFGYSHIKSQEKLYLCLDACKKEYDKRYKSHKRR